MQFSWPTSCPVAAEQEMQVCHQDSLQSTVRAATVLWPQPTQNQNKTKIKQTKNTTDEWEGKRGHCYVFSHLIGKLWNLMAYRTVITP